ncbi:hypothetical protein ACH347_22440 [Saccharopolyspora sp. 5N102]|uniref:hypothetical protein n=1 Tax=Saccharopolyspora sp. 5N102 TaxID=3375155 RepID=UPI0037B1B6D0
MSVRERHLLRARAAGGRRSSGGDLTIEVPDEAMMALPLDPEAEIPSGKVRYPAPFGI